MAAGKGKEYGAMKHYSIWSNYRFAYGPLWKKKKKILMSTFAEAVFYVFVPIAGTAVTSAIVGALEQGFAMRRLVCMILLAFAGYGVLNMIKAYLENRGWLQYIEARTELFVMQPIGKDLSISMEQYEDVEIHKQREKARDSVWSNLVGLEGFFHDNSDLLKNVLGLFVYSMIVGTMNPKILLILIGMSALSAAAGYLVTRYDRKIRDRIAEQDMTMHYINRIVDDIQGGKDIRIFGLGSWIVGKYDRAIERRRRISFGRDMREYGSNMLDTVLNAARDLICYLYLIAQLSHGMHISEFVFYMGLIGGFSSWLGLIGKYVVAVKRDSDMICDLRSYTDLEEDGRQEDAFDCSAWTDLEIEFDHVSYRYSGAREDTLHDVSFRISKGEKLALVGVNGAGKTTIVKLMSGLYLPTKGTVYVNGVSTRELDRTSYFKKQAAIFQEPFRTSYSIGENVALSEQYDEDRVWSALAQAELKEKIKGLDRKLETCLGKDISPDGIALSGGEMQKLLLARVLYRDAPLIMLDEPTAALDALAETGIYEKYHTLFRNKTVLFISHRLASTRFCDRIILLSGGRICEQGTHAGLMKAQGDYYEMFQVQSRYYQEMEEDGAYTERREQA